MVRATLYQTFLLTGPKVPREKGPEISPKTCLMIPLRRVEHMFRGDPELKVCTHFYMNPLLHNQQQLVRLIWLETGNSMECH